MSPRAVAVSRDKSCVVPIRAFVRRSNKPAARQGWSRYEHHLQNFSASVSGAYRRQRQWHGVDGFSDGFGPGRGIGHASGGTLNLFVSVNADGVVEIIAHRSAMGTGI